MVEKRFILLIAVFIIAGTFLGATNVATPANPVNLPQATTESSRYEIYPLPQNEIYRGTQFTITDGINVVIEKTIDRPTRNFLQEILASKSLNITISKEVVSNKTNVIIGTRDAEGYIDAYFNEHITYDASIFEEYDAYVLAINKESEQHGTIAILGKGTDAAYYALATLKLIFDQMPGKTIKSVKYEDYADTKFHGFIEGFYGIPWSYNNRKSLMRFGGRFKMNIYIYAPKDDPYHSASWRELYPQEELAKLAELVEVSHTTKTDFVWAIHPGFNMINWNDYEDELDTLIAKLEQLYSIGVRQFGLFMDDISLSKALENKKLHVQLVTDVANWVESKGDVGPLIYTPPFYNQEWTEGQGELYLKALRNVPKNVEIVWTGSGVIGTVNREDMQWVKDLIERKPFVWLNWPVNDYVKSRLMLGKGEVLQRGTHNIAGIVSNPMGQAELSKIALFAVADYAWNIDEFSATRSWLNSFKYVAPKVASALKTIAHHLSDPSPNPHKFVLSESENIKAGLSKFLNRFKNEKPVDVAGRQLAAKFDHILQAIQIFREDVENEDMLEEINPWLYCLKQVVTADKYAVKAVIAMQNDDLNRARKAFTNALIAMAASDNFTRPVLGGSKVTVEAGTKRLVPFANKLINSLDAQLFNSVNSDSVTTKAIYNKYLLGSLHSYPIKLTTYCFLICF